MGEREREGESEREGGRGRERGGGGGGGGEHRNPASPPLNNRIDVIAARCVLAPHESHLTSTSDHVHWPHCKLICKEES